eukprot:7384774-Prymnesium_polylepis.1
MVQWMHEQLLFPALGADMGRSRSMGTTREEQVGFLAYALGRVDRDLLPLPPPHRHADVVVLDQNIDLAWRPHLLGTDLVVQLREAGFAGATCIVSVGAEEAAKLEAMPGVDVASRKGDNGVAVAARLLRALARRAPPSEIVDLRAALAAMGDSRALLLQVVQHVRQLSVAALVAAQEAGDLDGVRRQAHRLSGEASFVRARAFCAACNELSKFRGDVEAAHPLVRATVARFEAL